jgi:hypothetical protein
MSIENPLWGAPRIHGELLKLGFEVAQSSVAKYMVKRRGPPTQGWRTFLRNHAPDIAAMDLFVVPTIGFDLLYAFIIVRLDRRDLVWIPARASSAEPAGRDFCRSPKNLGPLQLVPVIACATSERLRYAPPFQAKPFSVVTTRCSTPSCSRTSMVPGLSDRLSGAGGSL